MVKGFSDAFENRYFALIDIIGFSEKVLAGSPLASPQNLTAIYKEITQTIAEADFSESGRKAELTLFSDTIVLSTPAVIPSGEDLSEVEAVLSSFLWCVRRIAIILLRFGFLSRGCVLQGDIFHSESLIVGPAIVTAHYVESTIANFPRIMIYGGDLRNQISKFDRFAKWIRESKDGPVFLHILYEFEKFVDSVENLGRKSAEKADAFKFIQETCATINRYLAETRDRPQHFAKNQWFAQYLEEAVLMRHDFKSWKAWPKPSWKNR
jgi:hypothetical protein